jgi:hypothetical protein
LGNIANRNLAELSAVSDMERSPSAGVEELGEVDQLEHRLGARLQLRLP